MFAAGQNAPARPCTYCNKCLVNALLHRYGPGFAELAAVHSEDEGEDGASNPVLLRPGIVHLLDRGTSGVMVVARTARERDHLAELRDGFSTTGLIERMKAA